MHTEQCDVHVAADRKSFGVEVSRMSMMTLHTALHGALLYAMYAFHSSENAIIDIYETSVPSGMSCKTTCTILPDTETCTKYRDMRHQPQHQLCILGLQHEHAAPQHTYAPCARRAASDSKEPD